MKAGLSPRVVQWLRHVSGLDAHALVHFCVWLALDAEASGHVKVWPGEFANRHKLTYRRVRQVLAELVSLGLLDVVYEASRSQPAVYAMVIVGTVTPEAELHLSQRPPRRPRPDKGCDT